MLTAKFTLFGGKLRGGQRSNLLSSLPGQRGGGAPEVAGGGRPLLGVAVRNQRAEDRGGWRASLGLPAGTGGHFPVWCRSRPWLALGGRRQPSWALVGKYRP